MEKIQEEEGVAPSIEQNMDSKLTSAFSQSMLNVIKECFPLYLKRKLNFVASHSFTVVWLLLVSFSSFDLKTACSGFLFWKLGKETFVWIFENCQSKKMGFSFDF